MTADIYTRSFSALKALQEANETAEGARNEATTRLHLVDVLLKDCLGWEASDISCEHAEGGGYADYLLSVSRPSLVVEAKREGVYFELPPGLQRRVNLVSITRDNHQIGAAVTQVAEYCHKRGVQLACVCNGWQLISFVAVRGDGVPPLDGDAFVFDSLRDMVEGFSDLWGFLSRPGVVAGRVVRELTHELGEVLPPRLSSQIPSYPGYKDRNKFQTGLQIMSELVLQDLPLGEEKEEEFLRECYAPSGALSQDALVSKNILRARYAALFGANVEKPTMVPAADKRGVSDDLLAEGLSKRPIILMGDVGAGKTSFIRNLIKVEGKEILEDAVAIYIDLGSRATLGDDLKQFVVEDIERQLRENHGFDIRADNIVRGIYHRELESFRVGIYGRLVEEDPQEFTKRELAFLEQLISRPDAHLKAALEHLARGRKQQVICFLDNADQRSYDDQQAAFLIANEMAVNWHVLVYVALRPQTFFDSTQRGSLSGYHPKAFTIAPPRIDLVVKRRLDYAVKIARGEVGIPALANAVTISSEDLLAVLDAFRSSLDRNARLVEAIDNISGGNARRGLDLVAGFLGSGHVDTPEIARLQKAGSYTVPIHQFIRAIIYGDAKHYDPSRSLVANLFDLVFVDAQEHFLLPILLGAMVSLSESAGDGGFVAIEVVADVLQRRGFRSDQINSCLDRAIEKNLLQPRIASLEYDVPAIRVTTVGAYHFGPLVRQFTYVDSMVVNTPILDAQYRSQIEDVESIRDRLKRASVFVAYLDEQWVVGAQKPDIFDWPAVSKGLKEEIENIRGRLGS